MAQPKPSQRSSAATTNATYLSNRHASPAPSKRCRVPPARIDSTNRCRSWGAGGAGCAAGFLAFWVFGEGGLSAAGGHVLLQQRPALQASIWILPGAAAAAAAPVQYCYCYNYYYHYQYYYCCCTQSIRDAFADCTVVLLYSYSCLGCSCFCRIGRAGLLPGICSV